MHTDADTSRYLSALSDLREAHATWETAADGDSNDAEHAALGMAQEVDYILDLVTPWATSVPALWTFAEHVSQVTAARNGSNAAPILRALSQQATDLLAKLTPDGAPADYRAETVDAWVDADGHWRARIDFPAPGYDQATLDANLNRLRQRARRHIRRIVANRQRVRRGWRCSVALNNVRRSPDGVLARSVSFRQTP